MEVENDSLPHTQKKHGCHPQVPNLELTASIYYGTGPSVKKRLIAHRALIVKTRPLIVKNRPLIEKTSCKKRRLLL